MNIFGADNDPNSPFSGPDGDSDDPQQWSLAVKTPATVVHSVAIFATIFRLLYRWHLSRFAWDDTWATMALICDIGCLVSVWMRTPPSVPYTTSRINSQSNWLLSLTITSVLWFARMSILSSVIRIINPAPKSRFVVYGIGATFLAMYAGLLAQKIFICVTDLCRFTKTVATAQLITDVVSDTILVAVPIRFLRDVKLARDRRILVISAFSASMLITGVTILHSALLFEEATNITVVIGHVKAALALFVCNALVLVMFVYRVCKKSTFDAEYHGSGAGSRDVELTSVIELPSKLSSGVLPTASQNDANTPAALRDTCNKEP